MKGATVENSAIAISTLSTSNVPISGTSQNFLRSLANPHRSFNKSNISTLSPSSDTTGAHPTHKHKDDSERERIRLNAENIKNIRVAVSIAGAPAKPEHQR